MIGRQPALDSLRLENCEKIQGPGRMCEVLAASLLFPFLSAPPLLPPCAIPVIFRKLDVDFSRVRVSYLGGP